MASAWRWISARAHAATGRVHAVCWNATPRNSAISQAADQSRSIHYPFAIMDPCDRPALRRRGLGVSQLHVCKIRRVILEQPGNSPADLRSEGEAPAARRDKIRHITRSPPTLWKNLAASSMSSIRASSDGLRIQMPPSLGEIPFNPNVEDGRRPKSSAVTRSLVAQHDRTSRPMKATR